MPNLDNLTRSIADELEAVEKILVEETTIYYDFVDLASRDIIESGGKRLRPILLILSAKACGVDGKLTHQLAACLELIHIASLIHDDILDESPLRRGQSTLHAKWGNKVAVLVGDYLHARVLSMLVRRKADDVAMEILAAATQAMCEGEVMHAYKSSDFELEMADYLQIVGLKTGQLISAACKMGAILSDNSSQNLQALTDYGNSIGTAFQVIDDLLDIIAKELILGKKPFNDLREGKLTFPTIYLRDICGVEERQILEKIFDSEADDKSSIDWLKDRLEHYEVELHCRKVAEKYAEKAKAALEILPSTVAKKSLEQLADLLSLRKF